MAPAKSRRNLREEVVWGKVATLLASVALLVSCVTSVISPLIAKHEYLNNKSNLARECRDINVLKAVSRTALNILLIKAEASGSRNEIKNLNTQLAFLAGRNCKK